MIAEKVFKILNEDLGEIVTRGTSFRDDLYLDSLATISLRLSLEEAFNIELTDAQIISCDNAQDGIDPISTSTH